MKVKDQHIDDMFAIYNADCVEAVKGLGDETIDFSVFSPPFSSLYVYSDSENDMGNSADDEEFMAHFTFLIVELFRVIKEGRCVSVHCMNLPSSMQHHGYIGIRDFRGDIIRAFLAAGFVYHSEVCIWKNPVTAMQRTKALGLLHKQVVKDSCRSRQGLPDYVCTFRKPGDNPSPVSGEFDHYCGTDFTPSGKLSIDVWQRYASPVWMDIDQGRVLNYRKARGENDTRHICPLQLDVIHRCLQLWSKEGDVVLSPFAGIGSEGYESIKLGRKFIGFELKEEYYKCAIENLTGAQAGKLEPSLFDGMNDE